MIGKTSPHRAKPVPRALRRANRRRLTVHSGTYTARLSATPQGSAERSSEGLTEGGTATGSELMGNPDIHEIQSTYVY